VWVAQQAYNATRLFGGLYWEGDDDAAPPVVVGEDVAPRATAISARRTRLPHDDTHPGLEQ
jgi:hypothetical protein